MAALATKYVTLSGLNPLTLTNAAGGGDTFTNDGTRTFFVINNADASSKTVTFNDTGSVAPSGAKSFDADVEVTVAASNMALIGPFPLARFGQTVSVTYSAVTSVTVAAVRL